MIRLTIESKDHLRFDLCKKLLHYSDFRLILNLLRGLIRCTAINSFVFAVSTHVFLCALNSWQEVQILWLRPVWHSSVCDWSVLVVNVPRNWSTGERCSSPACHFCPPAVVLVLVRPVSSIWTHVLLERSGSSLWPAPSAVCVQGGFSPSVGKRECPASRNIS